MEELDELRREVREGFMAINDRLLKHERDDDRAFKQLAITLTKVEQQLDRMNHLIDGNGSAPLAVRLDRLEQTASTASRSADMVLERVESLEASAQQWNGSRQAILSGITALAFVVTTAISIIQFFSAK